MQTATVENETEVAADQFLTFLLDEEHYGIEVHSIREILEQFPTPG